MRLLSQHDADSIRRHVPENAAPGFSTLSSPSVAQYGPLEVVAASGRARCRCCGEKIKKDEAVIRATCAFDTARAAGSFASQVAYLHRACAGKAA